MTLLTNNNIRMKIMKNRILSLVLAVIAMLGLGTNAGAVGIESKPYYNEYMGFKGQGVISDDVSYEYWLSLKQEAQRLEEYLSNSDDFDEVYSSEDDDLSRQNYTMKKGDVLVTNGSSSFGIAGHAGIAATAKMQNIHSVIS